MNTIDKKNYTLYSDLSNFTFSTFLTLLTHFSPQPLFLEGVQGCLIMNVPMGMDLFQTHIKHHLGCKVFKQCKKVSSVRFTLQWMCWQLTTCFWKQSRCIRHKIIEVFWCPIEVRLQHVGTICLEAGIRSCLPIID